MSEVIANISGLDELEKQLNELLPNHARTAMRSAGGHAGEILVVGMEAMAPQFTGFLAHHVEETVKAKDHTIVVKVGPAKDAGYFRGGQGSEHHATFKGEAHVPEVYARFDEFGTVHQPARPFMLPTLQEKADEVINVFVTELQDEIEKAQNREAKATHKEVNTMLGS
jgi:HK97 gp10 family phage protein